MPHNYTRDAIKHAFLRLLNERPLSKISVRSIVDACNISRNTFYYHYQDIPSLLEEIIRETADSLIEQNPTVESIGLCVDNAFRYATENRRAIYHIYHSVDREAYEDFLMKMCDHAAKTHVDTLLAGRTIDEKERTVLVHFLKYACFGACMDWTKSGMQTDIAQEYHRIAALFLRVFNGVVFDGSGSDAGALPQGGSRA